MKRFGFLALLSVLLALPVRGQQPPAPPTPPAPVALSIVNAQPAFKSLIDLMPGGTVSPDAAFLWDVYPPVGVESVANGSHFTFTAPAGQYLVTLRSIDWTAKKISQATLTVTIGSVPPNPNPPGPGPQPQPGPGPAPIAAAGFRVLMVYDPATVNQLPQSQLDALNSTKIRAYLNAKCVAGSDGKTPEWRIWKAGLDASTAPQLWQDAFKRKRDSLPWIVISTGKSGFEGPLPKTEADTLTLLQKFGG